MDPNRSKAYKYRRYIQWTQADQHNFMIAGSLCNKRVETQ